jgi:NAD(P)-dependent dehydrogenase (short-subunit alcohol dehydrogenase family)
MTSTVPTDPVSTFAPGIFEGRAALITGGGRGIGRATALAMARLGADVALAGRTEETLRATASDVEALGRRAVVARADIRVVEDVEAMVAKAWDELGAVHFLVNNAGGQFPAPPSGISDRGWRAVVDLNLNGTWNVVSRAVPRLIETGYGSVVNIVHPQAFDRGAPTFAHSGAARAGVVNLARTMAIYLADKDITCNVLAPGSIDTEGWRQEEVANMGEDSEAIIRSIVADCPAGRYATAEEVAAQIVFLCSPAARYITGQALVADGGLVLGNWNTNIQPGMAW